jgi:hypothetical protein
VITLGGELSISGRVLDPDGAGVARRARLLQRAAPLAAELPSPSRAADGAFVIAGLEPGEYALTAQPDPIARLVAARLGPVRAGSTGVVLQLARARVRIGRRRASGERTWIVAFDANAARVDQTVTDEKGAFRIRSRRARRSSSAPGRRNPIRNPSGDTRRRDRAADRRAAAGSPAGATDVVIE